MKFEYKPFIDAPKIQDMREINFPEFVCNLYDMIIYQYHTNKRSVFFLNICTIANVIEIKYFTKYDKILNLRCNIE